MMEIAKCFRVKWCPCVHMCVCCQMLWIRLKLSVNQKHIPQYCVNHHDIWWKPAFFVIIKHILVWITGVVLHVIYCRDCRDLFPLWLFICIDRWVIGDFITWAWRQQAGGQTEPHENCWLFTCSCNYAQISLSYCKLKSRWGRTYCAKHQY